MDTVPPSAATRVTWVSTRPPSLCATPARTRIQRAVPAATTMFAAAALGMVLSVLEALLPARRKAWLPSPSALGISMVIPAATALTMVAGAVGGAVLRRRWSTATLTPVASGLIAGESVTGVALALGRVLFGG